MRKAISDGPEGDIARIGALDQRSQERLDIQLEAAMAWLCVAQDRDADAGVAGSYTLLKGWTKSYPETTGYIIPTFLAYARYSEREEFVERGIRMADWLLSVQSPDGSFGGGVVGGKAWASVFDTGQILFGLLETHRATASSVYLDAAISAGKWLVAAQDGDGSWPGRYDFMGRRHAYNARVAWPLLLLGDVSGEGLFTAAAARHVSWVLEHTHPDGFVDRSAFDPDGTYGFRRSITTILRDRNVPSFYTTASLHTLAYALEGLLESARLLGHREAFDSAQKGAAALAQHARTGLLAGFYGPGWTPLSRSLCLTGAAQMALVWMRLQEEGDQFVEAADRAIGVLLDSQRLRDRPDWLFGAVAGSKPLYGRYLPFRYPNWAVKFTADAYLARLELASVRRRQHLSRWSPT